MAKGLCESGIKAVAIFDIQPASGQSMAQALNKATGIPVKYYNVDVANEENVQSAVDRVVQQYGCIDILINSAGVAYSNRPAESHSLEDFEKTLRINCTDSFLIARTVARHMIAAAKRTLAAAPRTPISDLPDRSIIFIASMSGSIVNVPQPQSAYNMSKAGVIQFSKCLAYEWAPYGIRVNTISPGYMDTVLNQTPELNEQKKVWIQRTPQKTLGKIDKLNNVVVWLAGEGASFVTGSDVVVDGGYSVC
jgi:NAD(P)-dependent dehydrogenase (short-subunit alcohol dehydrogenase family)